MRHNLKIGDAPFLARATPAAASSFNASYPDTLSNLTAWWKADSLSLSNNDPVSTWSDSKGTNHGTGSGTGRPLYQTNLFGTKPGLHFDGNDQLVLASEITMDRAALWTIIIVFAFDTGSGGRLIGSAQGSGNFWTTTTGSTGANSISSSSGTTISGTAFSSAQTSLRVWSIRAQPAAVFSLRENKTTLGTPSSAGYGTSDGMKRIGVGGFNGAAEVFFTGTIAEIMIYLASNKTDGELDAMYNSYFKPKYTTLP